MVIETRGGRDSTRENNLILHGEQSILEKFYRPSTIPCPGQKNFGNEC